MRFVPRILCAGIVASLAGGCASGGDAARFPTVDEVRAIADAPKPAKMVRDAAIEVDTWPLAGPLPDAVGLTPHAPASPWDGLVAEAAARRPGLVVAAEELTCVAREIGRFFLAKGGMPSDELRRFIAARCGAPGAEVMLASQSGTVPASMGEGALFGEWREAVRQQIAGGLASGTVAAGIWSGREGDKAAVMSAWMPRRAEIDRTALVPDGDGRVLLRGQVLSPSERVSVLVNRGRFGYARCEPNPRVKLPKFEFECVVDKADASAWIEAAAFPPGRLIGPVVLSMLAWPAGAPSDTFTREAGVAAAAAGGTSESLLAALNQVRQEAALAPLVLAPAQTQTTTRVAPHYFAALAGAEPETMADRIYLGLTAGWEVEGMVSYGRMTSGLVYDAADVSRVLATALARPSGRETLLDPAAGRAAFGAVVMPEVKIAAALLCTYSIFDTAEIAKGAPRVLERLVEQRRRAGVEPPRLIGDLKEALDAAGARLARHESDPDDALQEVLQHTVDVANRGARGWVAHTDKLEDLVLPEEVIAATKLDVAIGAYYYRPEGEPWGHWAVFFIVPEAKPDPRRMAKGAQGTAPRL